jgi:hypothetical protein
MAVFVIVGVESVAVDSSIKLRNVGSGHRKIDPDWF